MARATNPRKRERGSIDELPSGALRVRVYAGTDPITKRRHDLVEVIPAGPKAWERADEVRRRFVEEVKQRRSPRTTATVDQLLDRYLGAGTSTLTMVPGRPRSHLVEEVHTDDIHARLAELDHSAS